MKERPILFSGAMVRAILEGRKSQTRRVIRKPERLNGLMHSGEEADWCPYGRPGDRLWARENWRNWEDEHGGTHFKFAADGKSWLVGCSNDVDELLAEDPGTGYAIEKDTPETKWRPSIFMPRWASRITLEVTDVRVERIQEISAVDVVAEGYSGHGGDNSRARTEFMMSWNKLNGKRGFGWDVNPWVWVVSFKRVV